MPAAKKMDETKLWYGKWRNFDDIGPRLTAALLTMTLPSTLHEEVNLAGMNVGSTNSGLVMSVQKPGVDDVLQWYWTAKRSTRVTVTLKKKR